MENKFKITLTKEQLKEINTQLNPKDITKTKDFKDIDTVEKACKYLGCTIPNSDYEKLICVITAINKITAINVKFPDWSNDNQRKYYPWFKAVGSGSGGLVFFGASDCYGSFFAGGVGYLESQESSDFVGKTFLHLYQNISQRKLN